MPTVPALEGLVKLAEAIAGDVDLDSDAILAALDADYEVEPRLDFFFPSLRAAAHLIAGDGPAARPHTAASVEKAAKSSGAAGTQLCLIGEAIGAWMSGDLDAVVASPLADPGPRWSIAERVPTLAVAATIAAHRGRLDEARHLLRQAHELVPDVGDRDFLAGFLAVADATLLVATGDERGAGAVIDAVMDRTPFVAGTTGRALVWLGAVPSLVSEAAAAFVAELPLGPSRRRALEAIEALQRVRAGEPPGAVALLDDARALLTVLPLPLAAELACGAAASRDPRGNAAVQTLRSLAPRETREALQRVVAGGPPRVRRAGAALLNEVPIPPPEPVRVEAFGPVQVRRDGEVVADRHWRRERVRQLLLLLVDRRAIRRAEVADLLWPELDADAVSSNLRTTLSYLHGVLEPHRRQGEAPYVLRQDAGVLRLADDESFTVDAWELELLLDRAAATERDGLASVSLSLLLDALALWRGPYLEDVAAEPWAEPTRRRMHERVTAAGIRASELLVAGGRAHDAPGPARTALDADPWSEAAYRALIGAHLALGDRAAAKRALAACRDRLGELGVEPDPATDALAAEVGGPG
ncbi:MAG: AfsR/SARP family transcriptional regulator [Actinomycetota bacterium]